MRKCSLTYILQMGKPHYPKSHSSRTLESYLPFSSSTTKKPLKEQTYLPKTGVNW